MTVHLAVFTKNLTNPAYAAARLGADRIADRMGAHTSHFVPRVPDDIGEQRAMIAEAIGQRPDAIVLVPVHETALNDAIAAITTAGIPLFTFVTPVTAGKQTTFVGADDVALGAAIASRLFATLGSRGRIVIVDGTPASATSRGRATGFARALRRNPGVHVAASIVGNYQYADALAAFTALPAETRAVDGVLCANDTMALGVLDALESAASGGQRPLVVGVNALPDAIREIARGRMLATADFDAMSMCALATEAACRHLRGEAVPAQVSLAVEIVDRGNLEAWNKPFEARATKSWAEAVG